MSSNVRRGEANRMLVSRVMIASTLNLESNLISGTVPMELFSSTRLT
jgi:hypothetical protein